MKIYTGYFAQSKRYQKEGLVLISIARFNRFFNGNELKILAPPANIIHEPEKTYIPKYLAILNKLSKQRILDNIKYLSNDNDCILLCYEKPGDFCHRNLVAEWLGEHCEGEFMIGKKQEERHPELW